MTLQTLGTSVQTFLFRESCVLRSSAGASVLFSPSVCHLFPTRAAHGRSMALHTPVIVPTIAPASPNHITVGIIVVLLCVSAQ